MENANLEVDQYQRNRDVNKCHLIACNTSSDKWKELARHRSNWRNSVRKAVETFEDHEQKELIEWAKCGDDLVSAVPTILWAVGAAALAQRLITSLFRRFLFRRIPLWELMFQNLLFIWMVIYSLHFWSVLVKILRAVIEYCYTEEDKSLFINDGVTNSCKVMQQWVIWMFGVAPLVIYIQTRPRPESTPLMIWITTSPWQRREMGPYGYYLNRPVSSLQLNIATDVHRQAFTLRKAFSDSKIILKEPSKNRRHSKSV